MYFTAAFSTALNLLLLRFGPRAAGSDDASVASRMSGTEWSNLVGKDVETGGTEKPSYGGTETFEKLKSPEKSRGSLRNRPSLMT